MSDAPIDTESTLDCKSEDGLLGPIARARVTPEEMELFKRLGGSRWLRGRVEAALAERSAVPLVAIPRSRAKISVKTKTLRVRVTSEMHADILRLGGSPWMRRELQRARAGSPKLSKPNDT